MISCAQVVLEWVRGPSGENLSLMWMSTLYHPEAQLGQAAQERQACSLPIRAGKRISSCSWISKIQFLKSINCKICTCGTLRLQSFFCRLSYAISSPCSEAMVLSPPPGSVLIPLLADGILWSVSASISGGPLPPINSVYSLSLSLYIHIHKHFFLFSLENPNSPYQYILHMKLDKLYEMLNAVNENGKNKVTTTVFMDASSHIRHH